MFKVASFPSFGLSALQGHERALARSIERLSTGKRVNRTSDDPPAMIAATQMEAQIKGINRKLDQAQKAAFEVGAAEGAMSVVSDLLVELDGLVVTAANSGGLSREEREGLQIQADSILQAIEHVVNTTRFGGRRLLADGFGIKVGHAHTGMGGIDLRSLGVVMRERPEPDEDGEAAGKRRFSLADLGSGRGLNLVDGDLEGAQESVRAARDAVSGRRGRLGAFLGHELEAHTNLLRKELEQVSAARSALIDTDYALEVAQMVRATLLRDATIAAILIGRQSASAALEMLEGMKAA